MGLAATTELYRRLLRLHILPTFRTWDVDEITPPRVRTWRTERLASIGATAVAKAYRLLKAILEKAQSAPERPVATVDQVDALADAIGPRWRLMVYLAAYGPARPEEQAELRRPDVSLEPLGVWVRRAAPELTTGRRAVGDTKSEAGKRFIVLPEFMHRDVDRHVKRFVEKDPKTACCSSAKRAPHSGVRPSGGNGGKPAPKSACRRISASTICGTPATRWRRSRAPRSRTSWSALASPPSVLR